jgi:hypothetical protein
MGTVSSGYSSYISSGAGDSGKQSRPKTAGLFFKPSLDFCKPLFTLRLAIDGFTDLNWSVSELVKNRKLLRKFDGHSCVQVCPEQ